MLRCAWLTRARRCAVGSRVRALLLAACCAATVGTPAVAQAQNQDEKVKSDSKRSPDERQPVKNFFRLTYGESYAWIHLPLRKSTGAEQQVRVAMDGAQLGALWSHNVSDHFALTVAALIQTESISISGAGSFRGTSALIFSPLSFGGMYRLSATEGGVFAGLQLGWTGITPAVPLGFWHGPVATLTLGADGKRSGELVELGPTFGFTLWYAPLLFSTDKLFVLSDQNFTPDGHGWAIGVGIAVGFIY